MASAASIPQADTPAAAAIAPLLPVASLVLLAISYLIPGEFAFSLAHLLDMINILTRFGQYIYKDVTSFLTNKIIYQTKTLTVILVSIRAKIKSYNLMDYLKIPRDIINSYADLVNFIRDYR